MENIQTYLKTLEEINQEMKYLDPHKWLLDIEMEDIPNTIETLQADIERLEGPHDFIGSKRDYKQFEKRLQNRITYLNECIEILQNIWNDHVEGVEE